MKKQSKIYPMVLANEIRHAIYSPPKLKWDFEFNQNDHKPKKRLNRQLKCEY